MNSKRVWMGAVILIALVRLVSAADIFGRWIAKIPSRLGTVETVPASGSGLIRMPMVALGETIFDFKADGGILTGTVSNSAREGKTPISEGKIEGDEISFVVISGVGENRTKLVYTGKVELNEIRFTREEAGRKGRIETFIAKREFQRHNGYVPLRIEAPVLPPTNPR